MKRLMVMLLLVGCGTPPLGWSAYPSKQVVVEGSTFDVRQNGVKALAIRRNSEWAPNFRSVAPRAARAMQLATGCKVHEGSLTGDAIITTGLLECDGLEAALQEQLMRQSFASALTQYINETAQ